MVFRIVIAGVSQCNLFAEVCLLAEYLLQNLPNFCYERIEKSVVEWKPWLSKINKANEWHHIVSPLIWKELLFGGSKPLYIGNAQEFLEYCYSYYHFDLFLASEKFSNLSRNISQYENKKKKQTIDQKLKFKEVNKLDMKHDFNKKHYSICISGANNYLTMYLVSGILEISTTNNYINKIYIFDENCPSDFMKLVEKECNCVGKSHVEKIVKFVEKMGNALTNSDLLIVMDHLPFRPDLPIGTWLNSNKTLMERLAVTINICAPSRMRIIFPNLGPACYNATVLAKRVTLINPKNIVVATSDLGMDIGTLIMEVTRAPIRNMFCSPVWGFVGINHLIDLKTTIHRYDSIMPYKRFAKVKNSTLCIGTISPELRSLEYLLHSDETLWKRYVEKNNCLPRKTIALNKAISLINTVKVWLFDVKIDYVMSLGIVCDGSFGLSFDGVFSQPAHLVNDEWKPATTFRIPKDCEMNIHYLLDIAKLTLTFCEGDLPPIVPISPCICRVIELENSKNM